jgi:glycosyltransferase involved in cell wall biosynthesis
MSEIRGWLDGPTVDVSPLPGGVLHVHGWVLFDGLPPDRVEIAVGDDVVRVARRGLGSPGPADVFADGDPRAAAAGFSASVVIPRSAAGRRLGVHVRAISRHGDEWHNDPLAVQVADEESVPAPPLRLSGAPKVAGGAARMGDGLRVLVFTHSLHLGGGELYLDELLTRLRASYAVDLLVVSPTNGPLAGRLEDKGIPVHVTSGYAVDADHYEGRISELQALIARWEPDAVLANTLGVFTAVDAALRLDLPVVWPIHESFELEDFIFLNWGSRGLSDEVEARLRFCLEKAHTVFEAQSTLEMYARQTPGLLGRHVHYGVDLDAIASYRRSHDRRDLRRSLGYCDDDVVVLCMGVFQERKAQLGLVHAFAEVAALFPDAKLALVGDHPTPYADSVREAIRALDLQERVRAVPINPDTYMWYASADVLVSASDIESLPRSILEAKAFGLPTLATDIFGVSEVITDARNGWLSRPNSGNALISGLYRALSCSSEERLVMSKACEEEAVRFDGRGYGDHYHEFLSALVSTRRRHAPHP